jgi:chromosome segregation ATPase
LSTRAEQITSEVKRLVLRCRQLEADLAKSVPKKVLDETVAKMQQRIDNLDSELTHTKSDLAAYAALKEQMDSLGKQISQQCDQITSQNEVIKSMSAKIETTVPSAVYEQSIAKIRELEQAVETKNREYSSLQSEKVDLEQRIAQMIPQEQFASVQNELINSVPKTTFDAEIQRIRSETVPKDQYSQVETRITELEGQLANSVPKSEFEEISQTIVSLTKDMPIVEGFPNSPTPTVVTN